eukprot:TRINITY_DN12871_c0_g1_i1.p1 TRINITY_DN12871_c0_g1~~TRINITY_DN12871_c0_g1_i1.p1  ORF type:complete len:571 (+),score=51.90 TRINITY_DN12871_c0_g1_i1:76-1788(+)
MLSPKRSLFFLFFVFFFVLCQLQQTVDGTSSFDKGTRCHTSEYVLSHYPIQAIDVCVPLIEEMKLVYAAPGFDSSSIPTTYAAMMGFKLLSEPCRTRALRLYCNLFFLPCDYASLGDQVPWPRAAVVPRLPCASICEDVLVHCAEDFETNMIPLPNCTTFPASKFTIPSLGYSKKCYNESHNMHFNDRVHCPMPFVYNPNTPDTPCGSVFCPDPSYSADEHNGLIWIVRVTQTIALCCILFLIIPYCLIPSRRVFPHQQLTQTFLANLFYLIPGIALWKAHYQDYLCDANNVPSTQETNTDCAFFGFWYQWHALSLSAWWLNLIIHLFVGVVLEATIPLWGYWIMFVIAWFGPLGLAIAGISAGKFASGTVFCQMDMSLSPWVSTIPLTLIYGTAIILLIPVIIRITSMLFWVMKGRAGRDVINSKLRQNLRILVFAAYYLIVIGMVIGLSWYAYDKQDYLGEGYGDYLACELRTMGKGDCHNPTRIPYGFLVVFYFVISIGAWVLFTAFGLGHTLIWVWWKTLITTLRIPDGKSVEQMATITAGTPTTTMQKNTSTHTSSKIASSRSSS